ncbi:MAG: 3-phenylpropionate/cinnamic acid dioxygenase subunit beta, partial [Alphaproteobacteria bacterium]
MSATTGSARLRQDPDLTHRVAQYFYHEADLLDERRFDDWFKLLHPEVHYWMPLTRNLKFDSSATEFTACHENDLNWFDEGHFEIEQRVKQIMGGDHWAEEPLSRSSHLITNVVVTEADETAVRTRCRFMTYRNRVESDTDIFVGKREDELVPDGDSFLIRRR